MSSAIVLVVLFVALSDLLLLGTPTDFPAVRAAIALPVLLFAPGYVLVASIFPRQYDEGRRTGFGADRSHESTADAVGTLRTRSITWTERIALSFGMSLAVLPMIGLVVAPIAGDLSFGPVLVGVNAFVVLGAIVSMVRRSGVPAAEQFRVPSIEATRFVRNAAFGGSGRLDRALSVALLGSVLLAMTTMGFVMLAPGQGEAYTGMSILTEGADGNVEAAGYPTNVTAGEDTPLTLQVSNNEGNETTYTIVGQLQRVATNGDSLEVREMEEVYRTQMTLASGERWQETHEITPTMVGDDLRLTYHLYRGEAPANPTRSDAYRNSFVWIDVDGSGE